MYNALMKLKKMYKRELWMKMVEQAKVRGKITEEEYERLVSEGEDDEA